MPKVLSPPTEVRTVADLLKQLGNLPPDRVWFRPIPGTATEQDVIDIEARHNRLCELVDGVLVEKTACPSTVARARATTASHSIGWSSA